MVSVHNPTDLVCYIDPVELTLVDIGNVRFNSYDLGGQKLSRVDFEHAHDLRVASAYESDGIKSKTDPSKAYQYSKESFDDYLTTSDRRFTTHFKLRFCSGQIKAEVARVMGDS